MDRVALGRTLKKLTPVSVVGILDYEGAHEIFKNLMVCVHEEQAAYVQMVNDIQESNGMRPRGAGCLRTNGERYSRI